MYYRKLTLVGAFSLALLGASCHREAKPETDPQPAKTPGSQLLLGSVTGAYPKTALLLTAGRTESDPLWAVSSSRAERLAYSNENNTGVFIAQLDTAGAVNWARNYQIGAVSDGIQFARRPGQGGLLVGAKPLFGGVLIARLNEQGMVEWAQEMTYMPYQLSSRAISPPIATSDGGFLIPVAASFTGYDQEFRLLKISATGTIQWSWQYNLSSICSSPVVAELPKGGYAVLTGDYQRQSAYSLFKLNEQGEVTWARRITGAAARFPYPPNIFLHALPDGSLRMWWPEERGIMQAQVTSDGASISSRVVQIKAALATILPRDEGTDVAVFQFSTPGTSQAERVLYHLDAQGNAIRVQRIGSFPNGVSDYGLALTRDARGRLYGLGNVAASQSTVSNMGWFKASLTDDRLCQEPSMPLPITIPGDLPIAPLPVDNVAPLTPYSTYITVNTTVVTTAPSRGCL
ncbi:hypothetical protein [Hymenobacter wooponensis]|uniref:Pyrrolo-quinoline quinone n=1 Tax=Hymenobacter wooponensis TaxID=1525360 RepID=A0A4Z0MM52_9BACT|nr:hypothetical protein [Hymenobacter wooponensis]TGD80499.1 hypothetical protein EU557_11740 [Hymenobacter wooponensis]